MNIINKAVRSLLLAALLLAPLSAFAGVFVSVNIAPPPLPVYEQPPAPAEGYLWTPGYWAWDDGDGDYYWVPGTWVLAPQPGYLWTPGWWGWGDGLYLWHAGYWGLHVGFYGGVNYGYGYGGDGYHGGEWREGHFFYNRSVNNVDITRIHNTYNTTVVNNITVNRVSYNGGTGGTAARPTAQERGWERERHIDATPNQREHQQAARADRGQFASANQGRPAVFATPKPGAFHQQGAVSHGEAAPFHSGSERAGNPGNAGGARPAFGNGNGAYQKNGPNREPQREAPAYVQHDRVPEGGHTPIAPQPRRDVPVQREMPQQRRDIPIQREAPQRAQQQRFEQPQREQPRFQPQQHVQPPPRVEEPRMPPPRMQEPPHIQQAPQHPQQQPPHPQERREPR